MKLPPHISFSQYNTYVDCPRNWYLSKIRQAEQVQTWYLPIGTAVHMMVEHHLDCIKRSVQNTQTAEGVFFPLISAQMEIESDLSKWLAGGPKADPVTGDAALQRVKDCFEKALEFLEDIDVWEVEYDASGPLPGLSVPVSAFIDIIGEHKKLGPTILDWKSGSKKPSNNLQLETYAALLAFNEDPKNYQQVGDFQGLWAMLAPGAAVARPIDLSEVDPAAVGAKYQKVRTAMEAMQIQANKKFMCKMCFNSVNCLEYSGPLSDRARYYDRSRHDQPPY